MNKTGRKNKLWKIAVGWDNPCNRRWQWDTPCNRADVDTPCNRSWRRPLFCWSKTSFCWFNSDLVFSIWLWRHIPKIFLRTQRRKLNLIQINFQSQKLEQTPKQGNLRLQQRQRREAAPPPRRCLALFSFCFYFWICKWIWIHKTPCILTLT